MRRLVLASAVLVPALMACGPAGGLYGIGMTERVETTGFGHLGTSVVCLGSEAGDRAWELADEDGRFLIEGTVVRQVDTTADVGNVDPCWNGPSQALVVRDALGLEWVVGYRWQSSSMGDVTPWIPVEDGDTISVTYKTGPVEGGAGFVVRADDDRMVFALESGRGGTALTTAEIPALTVERGAEVGVNDDVSGTQRAFAMRFMSNETGEEADLPPGGDAPLSVESGGESLTLCSINSYEIEDSEAGETSWILFE